MDGIFGWYFQCRKSRLCLPDFFLPPSLAHVNGLCCLLFIAEHKANLLFPAHIDDTFRERKMERVREGGNEREEERTKENKVEREREKERKRVR